MGGFGERARRPVLEQVEHRFRQGCYKALKAVFSPGVEVPEDHRFPFRVEVDVTPVEGEQGTFWFVATIYPQGLVTGTEQRGVLQVGGDDAEAVVFALAQGLDIVKARHHGKPTRL